MLTMDITAAYAIAVGGIFLIPVLIDLLLSLPYLI